MFPLSAHVVAKLGRPGRLAFHKGEGEDEEHFWPIEAAALNPHLSPLPLSKGRGN